MKYLTLIGAMLASSAFCAPRGEIAEELATRFDEHQVAFGLRGQMLFEVWASEAGTWTILQTTPESMSCIMATGTDWYAVEPVPAGTLN